jgi:hypothetical protein
VYSNNFLKLILFYLISTNAFAIEKFYYGDLPKFLEVNAKDPMLLSFPSPPLSVSCQPSGVVEINIIENERDLQIPTIAQNPTLLDSFKKGSDSIQARQVSKINNPLDLILKLNPIKEEKETRCSISLNNGEIVSLRIITKLGIYRPLVKFESAMSDANPSLSLSLNYLDTFSELIRGNGISRFEETTKDIGEKDKSTKMAEYKLSYSSTDRSEYKAWIYQVKLKSDLLGQLSLLPSNVGDLYVSSLLIYDITKKGKFKKGEELNLYILSRSSISSKELMERLP